MVTGNRVTTQRCARRPGIALRTLGALAHGQMTFGLAHGARATLANARIDARIVDARPMVATFAVRLAFTAHAVAERVARVAGEACAHRTLLVGVVVAGHTLGVRAARIRRAEVLCSE